MLLTILASTIGTMIGLTTFNLLAVGYYKYKMKKQKSEMENLLEKFKGQNIQVVTSQQELEDLVMAGKKSKKDDPTWN